MSEHPPTGGRRRPPSEGRRRRALRGEGDRLREEILQAAEELLVAAGNPSAVSIRAVASAVGVTPPSIYLHFADKDELIWAVCDRQFTELATRMRAAAQGQDPLGALTAMGRAYIQFGLENPEQYRIIFMNREEREPPWVTPEHMADLTAFGDLLAAVEQAIDTGAVRPVDPFLISLGLWAAVHGVTSLLVAKPGFPWPDHRGLVDHMLRTQLEGLLPLP